MLHKALKESPTFTRTCTSAFRCAPGRSTLHSRQRPRPAIRLVHVMNAAATESPPALAPFPDGGNTPDAIIFDLDGTLTETELLKARSYARTVQILMESQGVDELQLLDLSVGPRAVMTSLQRQQSSKGTYKCSAREACVEAAQQAANAAIDAYMQNIGGTTEDVARAIVDSLGLQKALEPKMAQYDLQEPWQALYKWRKEIYYSTFATDDNIYDARYMHNIDMLKRASAAGIPVAVATQSVSEDAIRVTKILGVFEFLKTVLGRECVAKPKPDPDIYLSAASALGVEPDRCLVFEDSVTGLTAATRAGMRVVAVANPFSAPLLQTQTLLPQEAVVYDVDNLDRVVQEQCAAFNR